MDSNPKRTIAHPGLAVKPKNLPDILDRIKHRPPYALAEQERDLNLILASCPKKRGDGIHQWLFLVARTLHRFPFCLKSEFILRALVEATQDCERVIPKQEMLDAVNNSNPANRELSATYAQASGHALLPEGDLMLQQRILSQRRIGLRALMAQSPGRECFQWKPQDALSRLFSKGELLCFVYDKQRAGGIATTWNDPKLIPFPPLMIPNPLLGKHALTSNGKQSERALANVGKRQYLVLEFDNGTAGEQAAIIWYLREQWSVGLVMVLSSGKRSLHAWWGVHHLESKAVWELCQDAYRVGACRSTFGKAQLVRVPNAKRPETGQCQRIYYFDQGETQWK
jgi:hypothetical protein